MSDNKNKNINDFLGAMPDKLDINKTISLYELVKENCPNTIKRINEKLYGKKTPLLLAMKEPKWYTSILNYLITKDILITEKTENGTTYNVTEEWTRYFVHPTSTVYFLQNRTKHLVLYEETAKDFLKAAGLVGKDGKETKEEKKEEFKNVFSKKTLKLIRTAGLLMLAFTLIKLILLASRLGIQTMAEISATMLTFTIGCLLLTDN